MNAREKMQAALDLLNEIKESGYWPFSSPAPCSTEVKIKKGINQAIVGIETAIVWHDEMFGKGRDDMSAPRSVIEQVK